jgi:Integrase core domain
MIDEGIIKNGLYILKYQERKCALAKGNDHELCHNKLGHPTDRVLISFLNYPLRTSTNYDICKMAKQNIFSFSLSKSKIKNLFKLVHSDVWGPAPIIYYNGFKYFILFIDDFSRATWLYLLKSKDEVFNCLEEFLNSIETQYNGKLKIFRSDNGTEFVNNIFFNIFKKKRQHTSNTCINTPK